MRLTTAGPSSSPKLDPAKGKTWHNCRSGFLKTTLQSDLGRGCSLGHCEFWRSNNSDRDVLLCLAVAVAFVFVGWEEDGGDTGGAVTGAAETGGEAMGAVVTGEAVLARGVG